jgi:preprotein translocase subunit SecA
MIFRAFRGLPKYGPLIKFLSEPGISVKCKKLKTITSQTSSVNMPSVDEELLFPYR